MVAERMFKLYLTSILAAEVVALAALAYLAPEVALFLVAIIPITLLAAFILRHRFGGHVRGLHRLSPEAIADFRPRVSRANSPEALSRAIVERAEEIQRSLEESPADEVRVEMCALGYRACANDMITLTHLTNEALPTASFLKRFRLRRSRKRAIDSLSEARKALPPGALRTAAQEK
jgi:ABC-type multidrug transport system fused ATPase/permease subunit